MRLNMHPITLVWHALVYVLILLVHLYWLPYLKNHGLNVTKWGSFLIGCVVSQVVIITIGKEIMVRPRMIAILEHRMS